MKKRILVLLLTLTIIIGCVPAYAFAADVCDISDSEGALLYDNLEYSHENELLEEDIALTADDSYMTIIMQGNTESSSDCRTFRTALMNSGYGYDTFRPYGWNYDSNEPNEIRVNASQVKAMRYYDVAYYSGHGGTKDDDGNRYPIINYIPSNTAYDYGTSDPINVAELFGLDSDNWQNETVLSSTNPLRVLVLASCSQLDSSIVKYYARMMKASGIRAIAGYHDTAPAAGDDTIATNFINNAKSGTGNSVWYSWQHANSGYNWAVLVYQDNSNQYYRLPGFPGKQYDDPSASATVYRYASFLSNPQATPTTLGEPIETTIDTLPLTLNTSAVQSRTLFGSSDREIVDTDISVLDDNTIVQNYFIESEVEDVFDDKICVQHYVSREEIDEDLGLLKDTETIVERTYDYYDTYAGIKIADSYIGASIDALGITNVKDVRKAVISAGESAAEARQNSTRTINLISESDAIAIAQESDHCGCEFDVSNVALAYAPLRDGEHVLCYEIMSSHGFYYVSVETGEIVNIS